MQDLMRKSQGWGRGEQRWGAKEGGDPGGAQVPCSLISGLGSVLPGTVACLDPSSTQLSEEPENDGSPSQTAGEEWQSEAAGEGVAAMGTSRAWAAWEQR